MPSHCLVSTAVLTLCAALSSWAAPQGSKLDLVWSHPHLDSAKVERIAMLPAASFERDLPKERLVEGMLARALVGSGHRWVSTTVSRTLLRGAAPNDSLLTGVRDELLKNSRLDSLSAIRVCGRLRTDAVLCIRVERMDQVLIEPTQSGKPSTTVQVKAALIGADGRMLWSISGSEVGEGAQQSASSIITPSGGVNLNPTATSMGPPSYEEVITKLFERWAPRFPSRPAAAAE
jgi:hypothetical protein